MATFLEKMLTRAWKGLFDRNTPGYLPDHLPDSFSHDIDMGKDLGKPVPSVGNIFLHDIAVGNAYGHLGTVTLSKMNDVSIPSGGGDIKISGDDRTSITLQQNGMDASGYWQVNQKVNRWTKKWGFVPWREEGMKYFKGKYTTTVKGKLTVNIKFHFPDDVDAPPTSEVTSLDLDLDRISVNFSGRDSDSSLLASVINTFQVFNNLINDKVQEQIKTRISGNETIKSKIKEKLDEGLVRTWNDGL